MPSGYYRYPTLNNDTVIFVCEDDLWTLPATGSASQRASHCPSHCASQSPRTSEGPYFGESPRSFALRKAPVPQRVPILGTDGPYFGDPGEGSASHPGEGITVKTMGNETTLRYREWVEHNRSVVHQATGDKVGYLHIPDMRSRGYAEFHRGFLGELDYPGLIVDLRFNGGGNVSALLLEKLARKRLGYDITRWNDLPNPYPAESVMGPMVALTNEHAGSDGDMFSHAFKLMGLGPLIGKRTWGGVVGIWPRHVLADGTVTTQSEFSTWFKDVGWGLENYGADPDIEVEITPQEYARGVDTQLERSIQEILSLFATNPPSLPDFSSRPNLAHPALSAR